MTVMTISDTPCELGEGLLWHPERGTVFWFDILGRALYEAAEDGQRRWDFGDYVSAAGWVDRTTLLIASASALMLFDLETGKPEKLHDLEADKPANRSNDGRADPQGGFWIGTMAVQKDAGAGAIYRYCRGDLRLLYPGITIPNAICFSPDGGQAYFTDTPDRIIRRVALDDAGWPKGDPEPFIDLRADGLNPDGAVTDVTGNLWNAQWGASRVAVYDPQGAFVAAHGFPAQQISCPGFGGPDLSTLYATSAREDLPDDPNGGRTFALAGAGQGRAEPRVIL